MSGREAGLGRCDVGEIVPGEGAYELGYDVYNPPSGMAPRALLICLAGGGLSRRYYSLEVEGAPQYHWADSLAAEGFLVVNLDYLGAEEASRPADGFTLTLERMALANSRAVTAIRARHAADGLPVIGLGSSMGGVITALTQASHGGYDALAILGAHPNGDADQLSEPLRAVEDGDPAGIPERLEAALREVGRDPYAPMRTLPQTKRVFSGGDSRAVAALKAAAGPVLTMPGLSAVIPGSWREAAAQVQKPVFLAFGETDFWLHPQDSAGYFRSCPDLCLTVLPQTGHTHLVFASVIELQRRFIHWATGLRGVGPATLGAL